MVKKQKRKVTRQKTGTYNDMKYIAGKESDKGWIEIFHG